MYNPMAFPGQVSGFMTSIPAPIISFINELPLYTVVNNKGQLLSKIINKKTIENRQMAQIDVGIGSSVEYKFNKSLGEQIMVFS
jgi:predicted solute-binding protein